MTNSIGIRTHCNEFSGLNYYVIEVDGGSLEDYVLKTNSVEISQGLVPTLLNWLDDPKERSEVWKRVYSNDERDRPLPILMCSEDIDFSCTLIVTDVRSDSQFVYWDRFGLEDSDAKTEVDIGSSVHWFEDVEPLRFRRTQYEEVIRKFRHNLDESRAELYAPDDGEVATVVSRPGQ